MRNFLRIEEAQNSTLYIQESLNYEANAAKNRIWFRGDSYELNQLYKQIQNTNYNFWGSVPTIGMEIRKIHTGLPKLIVNTLVNIVHNDLNDITISNSVYEKALEEIITENKLKKLLKQATRDVLVTGDGAFKIAFDENISELPIIEFYPGDKIDITYERGRMREVIFYTEYTYDKKKYILNETYGYGYITYKLFKGENEVDLHSIPQTKELENIIFDKSFCMAIPYIIYESDKWEGRGQSIFDGKCDNFDSLDEAWSQWIDALRAGRAKTYIPESLIPRNPDTGELLKPSYFDNRYVKTDSYNGENYDPKIDTEQPVIPTDNYLQTYVTALDLCLQGLISPSTLGIDNKKLDNAEAQREKEKTTLYSRDSIIESLNEIIPILVDTIFKSYNTWKAKNIEDIEVTVTFGEYATPSFEAVVETIGKAKSYGIMSIERIVEELYGDTMSDEEKQEEIQR
ncbi:MAG: phage portal protein, partial [Clostridiales bacterium]|nr:phage portal protein [Clostridiales bacterium]